MNYKPKSHNALSPYLHSENPERIVSMVQQVLGGREIFRALRTDGSIQHLELTIDDSILMLGKKNIDPTMNNVVLHVYVRDCAESYAKALELGCISVMAPQPRQDGLMAGIKDQDGITWWLATSAV